MGFWSSISFVLILMLSSFGEYASASSCRLTVSGARFTYQTLMNEVSYTRVKGQSVPYLDLNPKAKKTIVLASGFSMSMLSWLEQINLLVAQGYRVIAVENSNVGLHLKRNGLVSLDSNQGLYFDGETLMSLVLKLKPKGTLTLVGHSRGGAVAAIAADRLREKGQKVKSLKLFSTYVDYIWDSSYFTTVGLNWFLNFQPTLVGASLDNSDSESGASADEVIGLGDSERQKGYAYVFKGIQPLSHGASYYLEYSLRRLSNRSKTMIQIYGVKNDDELSPENRVVELATNNVSVVIFDDRSMTHYWPLEDSEKANEIIID